MRVAVIDYGSGNLRSAQKALQRAAAERGLSAEIFITSDPADLRRSDSIVLPGVGAFKECRDGLYAIAGMRESLVEEVRSRAKPFLGICVGMQLMASKGFEFGETSGFDWIRGVVRPIRPEPPTLKIPHMGWNSLELSRPHALLRGLASDGSVHAYFVHSFEFVPDDAAAVCATASYGAPIAAFIAEANMAGTQFHPEKSQATGLTLLANFLEWRP